MENQEKGKGKKRKKGRKRLKEEATSFYLTGEFQPPLLGGRAVKCEAPELGGTHTEEIVKMKG